MTTINVRSHNRRKPDRIKNDPFKSLIEARLAVHKARAERFEASRPVSYPRVSRAIAGHPLSLASALAVGTVIILLNHYGVF